MEPLPKQDLTAGTLKSHTANNKEALLKHYTSVLTLMVMCKWEP